MVPSPIQFEFSLFVHIEDFFRTVRDWMDVWDNDIDIQMCTDDSRTNKRTHKHSPAIHPAMTLERAKVSREQNWKKKNDERQNRERKKGKS